MKLTIALFGATALLAAVSPAMAADAPSDPQIAHIAYTAGVIDIAAGKQALARSHNKAVRSFAQEMVRDHQAVNDKALALVKKLHVTPEANSTSAALSKQAQATLDRLSHLNGRAFDRAYADNEVAYHKTVNGALESTLIPSAKNPELKSLLETGLTLFREHQAHAEQVARTLTYRLAANRAHAPPTARRWCGAAAVGLPGSRGAAHLCGDHRQAEVRPGAGSPSSGRCHRVDQP
jgi:putative membrane protein